MPRASSSPIAIFLRSVLVSAALALATTPTAADTKFPYLGATKLNSSKCNTAFNRYLSCFYGQNLSRCEAKLGKATCKKEKAAALGDLAVEKSMEDVFGKACSPDMLKMIEKNLNGYKKSFRCEPRDRE